MVTEIGRRMASGVRWTTVEAWGGNVISLLVFAILARLLEPDAFGLLAMAAVFIQFTQLLVDQGVASAVVQRKTATSDFVNTAFWITAGTGVVLSGIGIMLAGTVAALYGEPKLEPVVALLSLTFALSGLSHVQAALLKKRFQFRTLAFRSLVSSLGGGSAGVALALAGYGVMSLVAQQLIAAGLSVVLLWTVTDWRPQVRFSPGEFRHLVSFSANIIGARALNRVGQKADDLLIGIFLGPIALGYYVVAYKLLRVCHDAFNKVIVRVAYPTFCALQEDPDRLLATFYRTLKIASIISFPAFVGVGLLAHDLVPILFGNNWSASIPVMQILVVGGSLQIIISLLQQMLLANGRPSQVLFATAASTGVLLLGFTFAIRNGIVAMAIAVVATSLLVIPLLIYQVTTISGVRVQGILESLRPAGIATLALAVTILAVRSVLYPWVSGLPLMALCIGASGITYPGTLLLLDRSFAADAAAILGRTRKAAITSAKA